MLRNRVQELRGGKNAQEIFAALTAENDSSDAREEIVTALAETGTKPEELAACLSAHGYSLSDIAEVLEKSYEPYAEQWLAALLPLSKENSPHDKAADVFSAVQSAERSDWIDGDYDGIEPDEFIKPLLTLGYSPADVATLLYTETSKNFGEAVAMLPDEQRLTPEAIGKLAKELEIDLSDNDAYNALRDDLDLNLTEQRGT